MKKLIGLFVFLLALYGVLLLTDPTARSYGNHFNLSRRIGLNGLLCLGVMPLIICGGIDLSIGAVVGLCATLFAMWVGKSGMSPMTAAAAVLGLSAFIGLINGLFVTKLKLQPFVVTLAGLFVYRGLARWLGGDSQQGLYGVESFEPWVDWLYEGSLLGIHKFLIVLLVLAVLMSVLLHFSVHGRYLYAIGASEKTARYSGIAVDRYKIFAYVMCSLFAGLFSILYLTEIKSSTPSETGNFMELYAIAGAVLGGVSLRGGEGNVPGVLIGVTILWILPNLANMAGVDDSFQPTVFGAALLIGTIVDQLLRPRSARR
jgi:ribose transport system permease protein